MLRGSSSRSASAGGLRCALPPSSPRTVRGCLPLRRAALPFGRFASAHRRRQCGALLAASRARRPGRSVPLRSQRPAPRCCCGLVVLAFAGRARPPLSFGGAAPAPLRCASPAPALCCALCAPLRATLTPRRFAPGGAQKTARAAAAKAKTTAKAKTVRPTPLRSIVPASSRPRCAAARGLRPP